MRDFCAIYEAVVYCLQVLSHTSEPPSTEDQQKAGVSTPYNIGKSDTKTVGAANGLLHAVSSDSFILALHCNVYMSSYLKPLSVLLQGSHLDILEAYEEISGTIGLLMRCRGQSGHKFSSIFKDACEMTKLHGHPSPAVSRQVGRQTQRSNVPAATPEEYWRRSVFIPFLDTLIAELNGRFTPLSKKAIQALLLMPKNLSKLSDDAISDLRAAYEADLPEAHSLATEIERWKKKWEGLPCDKVPSSVKGLLTGHVNPHAYPNIARILHLLLVIPVTSANVERANSSLNFIKTDLRSTMSQDRLNALPLLYIHRSIHLDHQAVVDRFARAQPRRMLLVNPLAD